MLGIVVLGLAPLASHAQQPGQLTSQQFQANPAQLLANFPNGGPPLIGLVRQLTLSDPADLPLIIALLASANPDQANAIGTGLGQAALASVNSNQAYASAIQTQLAAAGNQTASLAWAAVMGDLAVTAATAGGAGTGGGVGSVSPNTTVGVYPPALPAPGITTSASNTPDNFSSSNASESSSVSFH